MRPETVSMSTLSGLVPSISLVGWMCFRFGDQRYKLERAESVGRSQNMIDACDPAKCSQAGRRMSPKKEIIQIGVLSDHTQLLNTRTHHINSWVSRMPYRLTARACSLHNTTLKNCSNLYSVQASSFWIIMYYFELRERIFTCVTLENRDMLRVAGNLHLELPAKIW